MRYHGQRFPPIVLVAADLRFISANSEGACDVRLQVFEGKHFAGCGWILRSGDASYDQDHSGYWGVSRVPGRVNGKQVRFNSKDVAWDLIEQAKDMYASR